MSVRIVRLGTPRIRGEGVRIGTVRRPPRGSAATAAQWSVFARRYRAEMKEPAAAHALALLAALSHTTDFSVGCYCEDETRCHRSILRQLLLDEGAEID